MGYSNHYGFVLVSENVLPWKVGHLYLAAAEHLDLKYLFVSTKTVLALEIFSLPLIILLPLHLRGADNR